MESVEGNGGVFKTRGSFFRVSDLATGRILVNVAESIGHAFFSAVVDDAKGVVWVFGAAHHRGWDNKGPCDDNSDKGGSPARGCYVGTWNSTDLLHWSTTAKSVIFPGGNYTQNNDVTLVRPQYDDWEARHGALPPHQVSMSISIDFCISLSALGIHPLTRPRWHSRQSAPKASVLAVHTLPQSILAQTVTSRALRYKQHVVTL
jgi:hypothetical protein